MKIVAIAGSLQERSANSALIRAAEGVAPSGMELVVYRELGDVPHLNPELDGDGTDAPGRTLLEGADGLLIASPEYGHSMPGVLKNALDWLVASGELSGMPIGLMSASTTTTGGIRAQVALTQDAAGPRGPCGGCADRSGREDQGGHGRRDRRPGHPAAHQGDAGGLG